MASWSKKRIPLRKLAMMKGPEIWTELSIVCGYVVLWVATSMTVSLYNNWILTFYGFHYPITLVLWHMTFCSFLSFLVVRFGYVKTASLSSQAYFRMLVPIAACYAITLWLGNSAYLHLSVSFVHMLKAPICPAIFVMAALVGCDTFSFLGLLNMTLLGAGIGIASYGEVNLDIMGIFLQIFSMFAEAFRLLMLQRLLGAGGVLALHPVAILYYIAPATALMLGLPFLVLEAPRLLADPSLSLNVPLFCSSAAAAYALNVALLLLIGKTSAPTFCVARVAKDWALLVLSCLVYGVARSPLIIKGHVVVVLSVAWYNARKYVALRSRVHAKLSSRESSEGEGRSWSKDNLSHTIEMANV